MNVIKKWLFGNEKNIMRDSSIWNLIYSVEYSLLSAVLMLIVTRISGTYDTGVFLIAYTVTQMMATIGSYGMRSFQASDIKKEYSFCTYYTSRIISVLAMVIICLGYSFIQGYDKQRMILIVILCGYRLVEDVEDVFHGEIQKSMRLDVASKIASIRIFVATICFTLVFAISKNLIFASLSLTISAAIISILLTALVSDRFPLLSLKTEWKQVPRLLCVCLPICAGGFLYNYLVNAPKYAIDRNLSEEIQTIFNILFMPVFAINMLSSFVFKPLIVKMGILWNENKKGEFIASILKQVAIIVGITVLVIVGGVIFGLDILGWMYGVRLEGYRMLFAVLILFGGFAAMVSFLVVVLTIVRKQMAIIVAYAIAMIIDLIIMDGLVIKYGIWGAGITYGIAMGVVMAVLITVLLITILGRKDNYD